MSRKEMRGKDDLKPTNGHSRREAFCAKGTLVETVEMSTLAEWEVCLLHTGYFVNILQMVRDVQ